LKLLLDTHIWLWMLGEPRRLGKRTLLELKKDANELWLSPISTWEALTLNFKGRMRITGDLATWLAQATAGTKEAPFTHEIALLARRLPLHQDPADRILAATAAVFDLTLVTADKRLLELNDIRTMANREGSSKRKRAARAALLPIN
jgi:PIN domain nuclease of toxin-antitoxin system